eukprot:179173_1
MTMIALLLLFESSIGCDVIHITKTQYYGGLAGEEYQLINMGKITEIQSWGIENNANIRWQYHGLGNMVWSNGVHSNNDSIQGKDPVESCDPFTLNNSDYIIGYRVLYGPCKACDFDTHIYQ